jgi:hypothetical protein
LRIHACFLDKKKGFAMQLATREVMERLLDSVEQSVLEGGSEAPSTPVKASSMPKVMVITPAFDHRHDSKTMSTPPPSSSSSSSSSSLFSLTSPATGIAEAANEFISAELRKKLDRQARRLMLKQEYSAKKLELQDKENSASSTNESPADSTSGAAATKKKIKAPTAASKRMRISRLPVPRGLKTSNPNTRNRAAARSTRLP